jgi:hypothetical protein
MLQSIAVVYACVAVFFCAMALLERQRKGTLGLGVGPGIAALCWPVSLVAVAVHISLDAALLD